MHAEKTDAAITPFQETELLAELKHLHHSQGKFGSLTILIVTLVIFFSAGIVSVKWQEILILILVLFLHESGHLLAMKVLRYQDITMFFIPFIGAAVSGKAKRETALKSCIVSLMGPFPGIVIGACLYFLFAWTNKYYLLKTAQIMLLLNAFNILPIMPLDGGRFIDVLFINKRYFRLIFALLGAVLFLVLAALSKDFVIAFIGVFSLIASFSNFTIHGLANSVRAAGVNSVSVEELLGNQIQFRLVVEKLKAKYHKLFEPKMLFKPIYGHMTTIVDTLKFVPAGILSKISLLVVYPILLFVSVAVAFFFLALNFEEKLNSSYKNGSETRYAERYTFGKIRSRIPINESSQYHGTGIGFGSDTTIITDIYYYENGFRVGHWITRNDEGDTIEQASYVNGRLHGMIRLNNGIRDTLDFSQLPPMKKLSTKIREVSQPIRSNYAYFE